MAFKRARALTAVGFALVDKSSGAAITTGTVTVYIQKDGGAQGTVADTPSHEGNGQWSVDLTGTEMDAKVVKLTPTHADAAPQVINMATVLYDPDDAVHLGVSALPNAAAAANGGLPTVDASNGVKISSGTGANQISLASGLVALQTASITAIVTAVWSYTLSTAQALATTTLGRFICDKLGLVTTGSVQVVVTQDADTPIQLYRGGSRLFARGNHIRFNIDGTTTPLNGITVNLGFKKQVAEEGPTVSLVVTGTVVAANTSSQWVRFDLTSTDTANLALDEDGASQLRKSLYAYKYTLQYVDGGNTGVLPEGFASVHQLCNA